MKNLFKLATLLFACVAMSFVSCTDPVEDWIVDGVGIKATLKSTAPTTAIVEVQTSGLSAIAWQAVRTDLLSAEELAALKSPMPVVIFAKGDSKEVSNGTTEITVANLIPNATYNVYIVGETASDGSLSKEAIVVSDIKTADFADDIRVHNVNYKGFSVDVKVPDRVKEEDHLIKWATSDLYLYRKNGGGTAMPDADCMILNDKSYGSFFFNESTTIVIDEDHSFATDANGKPDYNTWLYETLVPGQPQIFMLGEHEFGQSPWGWGWGYYDPMFNASAWAAALAANGGEEIDQTPYWTGMHHHELIMVKAPEKLDDSMITLSYETYPDDALITIKADKSFDQVAIMILDNEGHDVAMRFLDNNPDYLQWFATSYVGMMEGATFFVPVPSNGTIMTALSEFFLEVVRDSHFWVYVVGIKGDVDGDGYLDGHQQLCKSVEFDLPKPTKPAPELVVTALESDPLTASYRIQCPTGDAAKGYWMANYEKEWRSTGMTAEELIRTYAKPYPETFSFSAVEIDMINDPEGLIVDFPSRANENFHFAAMVANDEGTETYSDAVICRVADVEIPRIDSPYFESLKGEWTASATVKYSKLIENDDPDAEAEYEAKTGVHTSKVVFGDIEYPEVLPESVYDIYAKSGVSREKTDIYFNELKTAADLFNESTRSRNRILANGFDFSGEMLQYLPYFNYMSAFDLFCADSKTYNGVSTAMAAYDFGPKWYIEVLEDGSLAVPFNTNDLYPMGSWYYDSWYGTQEIHMIAYEPTTPMAVGYLTGKDANGNAEAVTGYFPVEVSADGNTLTIKPFEYTYTTDKGIEQTLYFYPNAGVGTSGATEFGMSIAVISEITLTRNGGATPAMAPARGGKVGAPVKQTVESSTELKPVARPKTIGTFGNVTKGVMVGPDHSKTPEQRGEQWLNAWGRNAK